MLPRSSRTLQLANPVVAERIILRPYSIGQKSKTAGLRETKNHDAHQTHRPPRRPLVPISTTTLPAPGLAASGATHTRESPADDRRTPPFEAIGAQPSLEDAHTPSTPPPPQPFLLPLPSRLL